MAITTSVELTGAVGDYISWDMLADLSTFTSGFSLRFQWKSGDRSFLNQPTVGGTVCGHVNASQVGWQLDAGAEAGTLRFYISNGVDALAIWRLALPQPGYADIILSYDPNAGSPVLLVMVDGYMTPLESNSEAQPNGLPVTGETALTFGSRLGASPLSVGAFSGVAEFWSTALTPAQMLQAFNGGKPQDYATSAAPVPLARMLWGSLPGDTATAFGDERGGGRGAALVGAWATGGVSTFRPSRPVGVVESFTGNNATPWVPQVCPDGQNSSPGPSFTVTSVTSPQNAVRISGSPAAGYDWREFVRFDTPRGSSHEIHRLRCISSDSVAVFGLTWVPFRTGDAAEAQAVMCLINTSARISTIHTGEFNATFSADRVRSDVDGTVAVDGGGTLLPGVATADDEIEIVAALDVYTITFFVRSITQGTAFVRLQHTVDNEVQGDGLADLAPQSGYLSITKLTSGDIDVLEYEYTDRTIENPDVLVVCDSLVSVDPTDYEASVPGYLNTQLEGSASPLKVVEVLGSPGDQVVNAQDLVSAGHAARIAPVNVMLEVCGNTLGISDVATTSPQVQALLSAYRAISSVEIIWITYIVPGTWGSTPAPTWNAEVDSIVSADPNAYALDVYTNMGSPTGTNNKNLSLLDADETHPNDAGHSTVGADLQTAIESIPGYSGGIDAFVSFGLGSQMSSYRSITINASVDVDIDSGMAGVPTAQLVASTAFGVAGALASNPQASLQASVNIAAALGIDPAYGASIAATMSLGFDVDTSAAASSILITEATMALISGIQSAGSSTLGADATLSVSGEVVSLTGSNILAAAGLAFTMSSEFVSDTSIEGLASFQVSQAMAAAAAANVAAGADFALVSSLVSQTNAVLLAQAQLTAGTSVSASTTKTIDGVATIEVVTSVDPDGTLSTAIAVRVLGPDRTVIVTAIDRTVSIPAK